MNLKFTEEEVLRMKLKFNYIESKLRDLENDLSYLSCENISALIEKQNLWKSSISQSRFTLAEAMELLECSRIPGSLF